MPQHSIQISRQSEDSQQASMMPQSMSQGQLQSSPRSSVQQQQQQASDVHAPHEACAATMLQSVRNSQKRQAKMQWTQQSGSKPASGEKEQKHRHKTEINTTKRCVCASECKCKRTNSIRLVCFNKNDAKQSGEDSHARQVEQSRYVVKRVGG